MIFCQYGYKTALSPQTQPICYVMYLKAYSANILSTFANAFIPSPPPISVSDPLDFIPQFSMHSFPFLTLEELQSV